MPGEAAFSRAFEQGRKLKRKEAIALAKMCVISEDAKKSNFKNQSLSSTLSNLGNKAQSICQTFQI